MHLSEGSVRQNIFINKETDLNRLRRLVVHETAHWLYPPKLFGVHHAQYHTAIYATDGLRLEELDPEFAAVRHDRAEAPLPSDRAVRLAHQIGIGFYRCWGRQCFRCVLPGIA